jgi:hypothetical protein
MSDDALRALPRDAPGFHRRQASHLRALAASETAPALKKRLIGQAERHDTLAERAGEPELELAGALDAEPSGWD